MAKFAATPLPLDGALLLTATRHGDDRGFFMETWSARAFAEIGLDIAFVQDNHARSARAGTVRGLHFQAPPRAQGKLVRVLAGAILDVILDLRRSSPSYGRAIGIELRPGPQMIWVPRGFAHGYCTLEDGTDVAYKTDDDYAPETEGAVFWADPALGLSWPVGPDAAIVSGKDQLAPRLADLESPFP